jgi:hypothetical protein
MRVLFDKSAPHGLIRHLRNHVVFTAEDRGWDELENGDLLTAAERDGFDGISSTLQYFRTAQRVAEAYPCVHRSTDCDTANVHGRSDSRHGRRSWR